jgi:hypothetical protein
MRALAAAIGFVLGLGACSDVGPFYCDDSAQCMLDGVVGTCVLAENLCAFPDATCPAPAMLRYDDSADDLAGVCVGDE